jgi:phage tail tape-measure protein
MHDLGTTQMESFEYDFEAEGGVFSEAETTLLASELMEVQNEAELEQFLGDLIKSVGKAAGSFIKGPAGQALGGLLKSAAKQALPAIGSAVGGYIGGDTGKQIGSQLGSFASDKLGLEMEQDLETAKSFVQMAGDAAKQVAAAPAAQNPVAAANAAVTSAAEKHLPALLQAASVAGGRRTHGKWVRHGNRIILHGV